MSAKNKKRDLNKPVADDGEYQIQTAQANFGAVEQKINRKNKMKKLMKAELINGKTRGIRPHFYYCFLRNWRVKSFI